MRRKTMTQLDAILTIEGDPDADERDVIDAWQYLIDTAIVWKLQGSYQRGAVALIEAGVCTAPDYVEG
jgi:hypothetical protein